MNFYPDKIQVYERHIYIIGHFSSINSVSKLGIARFDKITGTLDSSFTATLSTDAAQTLAPNSVYSLEIFDDKIYVSGNFSYVNGTARSQFARLNLDGSLDSFNPSPNGYIDSIKKVGDYFFLGGHFSSISGQGSLSGLVKYKRSDDSLTSTGLTVSGYVNSLDYDSTNNLLLVGGGFLTAIDLNGVSRKYLGSYDLTTNRWTSFAPNLNRDVDSLSYYAGKIFAVGDFSQVYSSPINNLARLKLSDGTLDTSFTPNIGGSVSSMIYDSGENSILLGGLFTSAFTQDSYLTKIDLGTFNKKAGFVHGAFNGSISKLHRKNNNIYAIGSFTTFNSSSMKYLAKFDFLTGAKDGSFIDSEANNQILDISSDNDSLFIGGNFTSIEGNSTDAKYIAALDFNGNLKTNFFNHYPLSSYSFMHYFNNVLYVKASYDYDSNGSSEYGAKFDLTSNTGTHDSSYPLNFASSSSMVILPDSSAYILYDGNIDSINLATGAQSTYLNLSYSLSGKLFGVNNNLLFVHQNTYRLFPVK
jgi:hypothetical protein